MNIDRDTGGPEPNAPAGENRAWVTFSAVCASLATFVGLAIKDDYESWSTLALFGYLPAEHIRAGGYWALITSTLVHFAIWHVALNVYWLWVLGSQMESAIGSGRYFCFFLLAAFVSSAFQLASSDTTGIGASGVVCAIFGCMWHSRERYPEFSETVDWRLIQWFMMGMFGCVVAQYFEIADIGNTAHFSGLLFGITVARAFTRSHTKAVYRGLAALLVGVSAVPLFWCPWSVSWLSTQAYEAHVAEDYDQAVAYYSALIKRDPENAWAYLNRSYALDALGKSSEAGADLEHARKLDPHIEELPEAEQ